MLVWDLTFFSRTPPMWLVPKNDPLTTPGAGDAVGLRVNHAPMKSLKDRSGPMTQYTPVVKEAHAFREISLDFTTPAEFFRESIPNSLDAYARRI